MGGYVKLYRSIEQWEWYTDLPTFKLFTHCLIHANHKPNRWHGITIESGTFVTSYDRLSRETGLSVRSIRTSLEKLKSTGELTSHATNRFTLISIVKWADYQSQDDDDDKQNDKQPDTQATNKRQTNDKQTTTNKNEKNEKNDKNEKKLKSSGHFTPPTLDELKAFILENDYDLVDPQRFMDHYISVGWKVGRNSMKDWKATVRQWQAREKERKPSRPHRIVEPIPQWYKDEQQNKELQNIDIESLKDKLARLGQK